MYDRFLAPSGRSFAEWAGGERNWHPQPRRRWRSYEERGFATQSGKVELIPRFLERFGIDPRPTYTGPPYARPDVDDESAYPLQMLTGSRVLAYMGSTLRQARRLRAMHPDPTVEIHPETADLHGIGDGDWVVIERPEGSIRQRAKVTDDIRAGTVNVTGYWWDPVAQARPRPLGRLGVERQLHHAVGSGALELRGRSAPSGHALPRAAGPSDPSGRGGWSGDRGREVR